VLDEGRLTDNKGRMADFKNTVIIMTSNMGSQEIQHAFESHADFDTAEKAAYEQVMKLLKTQIRPEFLNRIDDIVLFAPLTQKEIQQIVRLQFDKISQRLAEQNIRLIATEEAIQALAVKGFDPQYGGRPVKRTLQNEVINALSKALLAETISNNQTVVGDYFDDQIVFSNSEKEPETQE
jgi:ATP-dependent Clp protease ATP-binding subunit ClpB